MLIEKPIIEPAILLSAFSAFNNSMDTGDFDRLRRAELDEPTDYVSNIIVVLLICDFNFHLEFTLSGIH